MQISKRAREITLVLLVAFAAALANLPGDVVGKLSIQRDFLLGMLALTVFIALFLYLKFQFFFLVVLLAVAANMPAEVADNLGISKTPLIIAMATTVGFSLINYVIDLLPTGLEKTPRQKSAEGIKVLLYAIEKGNLKYAHKILSQNFDPNLVAENGYTRRAAMPEWWTCCSGTGRTSTRSAGRATPRSSLRCGSAPRNAPIS